MKLLLDQGLPRSTVRYLRDDGMIVDHVAEIGLDRAADEDIIAHARSRGQLIVTLDADFHALLVVSGAGAPSTIRIRREGLRGLEVAALIRQVLAKVGHELERGAMVTVTERTIRVRHLPLQPVKSDL
jgi:predicted nuclease of predicted toxin-antitoxin system